MDRAPWRPPKPEPSPAGVLQRRELKVHLYAQCWNEAEMLPFFFRHYDGLVDQYFIYDDGSDDGSSELLSIHPKVDARRFQPDEVIGGQCRRWGVGSKPRCPRDVGLSQSKRNAVQKSGRR